MDPGRRCGRAGAGGRGKKRRPLSQGRVRLSTARPGRCRSERTGCGRARGRTDPHGRVVILKDEIAPSVPPVHISTICSSMAGAGPSTGGRRWTGVVGCKGLTDGKPLRGYRPHKETLRTGRARPVRTGGGPDGV
ncbi:hypothetical protein RC1_2260 [Rhodospirillum centenum SW]|uniref:Uncharacterized protein n=1 Tax=Rhodospirillum centenum (strain ATCC 51521 / SW) TaxID=414684 RepID=B6IPE5_RHOCS|nr:hypothetical protein RC1_2260 [Rhodospirillum centenum SW]